jgi:hypothetical protein
MNPNPNKLSNWGNDTYGDCVTAEEAFAKVCTSPEVFIPESDVIAWATRHGVLNGAYLTQVMGWMQNDGFIEGPNTYNDGPYVSVNWTDAASLQSAISKGPVKMGVAADQIEVAWRSTGGKSGWIATGFHPDAAEDHCVSLCGYGPISWLAQQLNVQIPAGVDGSRRGYAMFTWNSIGIIDASSMVNITHEAWLRQPTTVTVGNGYDESKWLNGLYEDLLGRAPDPGGLAFWVANRHGGMSANDVVDGFLNSTEYCSRKATSLYQEILDRAPDPGGLQTWTSELEKAAPLQEVLLGFFDSAEFKTKNPPPDEFVESLYRRLLGRGSDPVGKSSWVNALNGGRGTGEVVDGFLRSSEYCTNRVTALYQTLLGRAPDAPGLTTWVDIMTRGTAFQAIQRGFLASDEYRARALLRF